MPIPSVLRLRVGVPNQKLIDHLKNNQSQFHRLMERSAFLADNDLATEMAVFRHGRSCARGTVS